MSPQERAEQDFGYAPTYPEAVWQDMHPQTEQQQQQGEHQVLPAVTVEQVAE